MGFPDGSDGKESACNSGDSGSIPESGRFPREGNDYPVQYPCLENSMDRGAWWAPDSLEKTLMLGKTEGRRRRRQQSMRWLDGITDSKDKFG